MDKRNPAGRITDVLDGSPSGGALRRGEHKRVHRARHGGALAARGHVGDSEVPHGDDTRPVCDHSRLTNLRGAVRRVVVYSLAWAPGTDDAHPH